MYEFQEYPKCKYHLTKETITVSSKEEEDALGDEWVDNPGHLKKEDELPFIDETPKKYPKRSKA